MGIRGIILSLLTLTLMSCGKGDSLITSTYQSCGVVDILYNEMDINYIESQFRLDACTFDIDLSQHTVEWIFTKEGLNAGCATSIFNNNAAILINENIWKSSSYEKRTELVYHELGHAWFDYCHSDDLTCNPSGEYRDNDIMKGRGYSSDFIRGRAYFFLGVNQFEFPEGTSQPQCKTI